jgi:hypothetical protein
MGNIMWNDRRRQILFKRLSSALSVSHVPFTHEMQRKVTPPMLLTNVAVRAYADCHVFLIKSQSFSSGQTFSAVARNSHIHIGLQLPRICKVEIIIRCSIRCQVTPGPNRHHIRSSLILMTN